MIIRVGIPYAKRSNISKETLEGLKSLKSASEFDTDIIYCQGSNIPRARNGMINKEMSDLAYHEPHGFDYVLCVDSDIGFNKNHVLQLLDAKKDIIGGLYSKKDTDFGMAGDLRNSGAMSDFWIPMSYEGIRKVGWIGAGFLLISRTILGKIEYPWFRTEIVREMDSEGKIHQQLTGEDIGFCINARRHKQEIWVDCNCKVTHV